jgi:hypothetical protein
MREISGRKRPFTVYRLALRVYDAPQPLLRRRNRRLRFGYLGLATQPYAFKATEW